ncbi:MAG: hypothetical protein ACI9MC_003963 [Kiritimatiellia bacterium]
MGLDVCLVGVSVTAILVVGALEDRLVTRERQLAAASPPDEPVQTGGDVLSREVWYEDLQNNTLRWTDAFQVNDIASVDHD